MEEEGMHFGKDDEENLLLCSGVGKMGTVY